jgi:glycosyltransferase involved in cell wall biosynthesis
MRNLVDEHLKIAVVIPCFRVKKSILNVIASIGSEISNIYVIDDACPEFSGQFVQEFAKDARVKVLFNERNLGVGGAVIRGYQAAMFDGAQIVVKVDGDGQMNPEKISELVRPLILGQADYTKGNRFLDTESIKEMPKSRIFGNLVLSFFAKFSTGYWHIFDPNNGFTAIKTDVLRKLPLTKIDNRFFFESDVLFRLNIIGARVEDIHMPASYGNEISNLNIRRVILEFPVKHIRNFAKRIAYLYYVRDFSIASIELPLGLALMIYGLYTGFSKWIASAKTGYPTETGTLILVAMSILIGLQLILAFLSSDMNRRLK